MNLIPTRHLIAAILLSSVSSSVALSAADPTTVTVPHRGTATATSYSNDFFNVRVETPAGWTTMTDDELAAMPNELIGGPIRSLRSGVPLASLPQFPLTVLINTEAGRNTQSAANVIVAALSLQGGSAASMPVIAAMIRDGARTAPGVKTVSPIYTESLAGKNFRRFDTLVSDGRRELRQQWYLAESHGYAILIMSTAGTAAEDQAVAALMQNFTFEAAAPIARR